MLLYAVYNPGTKILVLALALVLVLRMLRIEMALSESWRSHHCPHKKGSKGGVMQWKPPWSHLGPRCVPRAYSFPSSFSFSFFFSSSSASCSSDSTSCRSAFSSNTASCCSLSSYHPLHPDPRARSGALLTPKELFGSLLYVGAHVFVSYS